MNAKERFNVVRYPKTFAYVIEHEAPNIRCNRCGCPVLKSDVPERGYVYQCMACDEDLFTIETYFGAYHSAEELNELCLNTRDLLLLDEMPGLQLLPPAKKEIDTAGLCALVDDFVGVSEKMFADIKAKTGFDAGAGMEEAQA